MAVQKQHIPASGHAEDFVRSKGANLPRRRGKGEKNEEKMKH